jgi:adenosylmethionine-8-amino-7-oxononanoate aminotransferase
VLEGSAAVTNVRVLGTVLAFDRVAALKGYDSTSARGVADYFIRRGVLVRPLGEVLYVLPPYCITDEELGEVYRAIEEFLGV